MLVRICAASAAVLAFAASGAARDPGAPAAAVEGSISGFAARGTRGLAVELRSERDGRILREYPDAGGAFAFRGIAPGGYELRVTDTGGAVLYLNSVAVRGETARVSVDLPAPPDRAANPGAVSFNALRHKIPGPARKEFRKAEQSLGKGRLEEAVEHLRLALAADELYTDAYVNLGSCLVGLKRYDEAAGQFRKALALDPGSAPARVNLAHVLLLLDRFPEAEREIRHALRLEPHVDRNHYLLGLALRGQHRDNEALREFENAAPSVPMAGMFAAELLAGSGRNREAARHLRAYLDSGDVPNRTALESWLRRLTP